MLYPRGRLDFSQFGSAVVFLPTMAGSLARVVQSIVSACSVVTSVNQTSKRSRVLLLSPCSGCENGLIKSELSFNIRWFHLNGITTHLATRIHEAYPVREFKSQSADKAIHVLKCGQSDSHPKARTRQS